MASLASGMATVVLMIPVGYVLVQLKIALSRKNRDSVEHLEARPASTGPQEKDTDEQTAQTPRTPEPPTSRAESVEGGWQLTGIPQTRPVVELTENADCFTILGRCRKAAYADGWSSGQFNVWCEWSMAKDLPYLWRAVWLFFDPRVG